MPQIYFKTYMIPILIYISSGLKLLIAANSTSRHDVVSSWALSNLSWECRRDNLHTLHLFGLVVYGQRNVSCLRYFLVGMVGIGPRLGFALLSRTGPTNCEPHIGFDRSDGGQNHQFRSI